MGCRIESPGGEHRLDEHLRRSAAASFLLSLILLAAGCGGGARQGPEAAPAPGATDADPNLRAEARELRRRYEEAGHRGLFFYAPRSMSAAREVAASLDSLARAGADAEALRDRLSRLEELLDAADRAERRADSLARPLLARWEVVEELAGPGHADGLSTAREAVRRVMRRIEDGESPDDEVLEPAHRRLAELQARVLEDQLLAPVRARIEELRSDGAGEVAPRSLRRARRTLEEARSAIERAPFDLAEANRQQQRAEAAAARARQVSERVRRLQDLEPSALEEEVLVELEHLEGAAAVTGALPAGDRPLGEALARDGRRLERLRESLPTRPATPLSGSTGSVILAEELDLPDWVGAPAAATGFNPSALPASPARELDFPRDPPPTVRLDGGIGQGGTIELAGTDRETGTVRIGGHGSARFVVGVAMLVADSTAEVDSLKSQRRVRVLSRPSEDGPGRYLLGDADYFSTVAPVQEILRKADALPEDVTYTFSSLDAMATLGLALKARREGHDVRLLWLDEDWKGTQ